MTKYKMVLLEMDVAAMGPGANFHNEIGWLDGIDIINECEVPESALMNKKSTNPYLIAFLLNRVEALAYDIWNSGIMERSFNRDDIDVPAIAKHIHDNDDVIDAYIQTKIIDHLNRSD